MPIKSKIQDILDQDHDELDTLFSDVFEALADGNCEQTYLKLDYFWARLAMHIRAEHLWLFPAVINISAGRSDRFAAVPAIITELRADHDFFIREIARAIKAMRLVFEWGNENETIEIVKTLLEQVQVRLIPHNQMEEDNIYPMVASELPPDEMSILIPSIMSELRKLPHRFRIEQDSTPV